MSFGDVETCCKGGILENNMSQKQSDRRITFVEVGHYFIGSLPGTHYPGYIKGAKSKFEVKR